MPFDFDSETRRRLGYRLIDRIDEYFSGLAQRPVQLPEELRTFADLGDLFAVFANEAPEKGARGVSAFIIEKGTPGLKLSGVPFEKVGMPSLPPYSSAATSETIQHTLYGGLLMPIAVLGALTWVAKRNVKPEDGEGGQS